MAFNFGADIKIWKSENIKFKFQLAQIKNVINDITDKNKVTFNTNLYKIHLNKYCKIKIISSAYFFPYILPVLTNGKTDLCKLFCG